jgi:hypothetical protein
MKPEDIRRLYRRETPATEAEAAETTGETRTDPEQARRLIEVLYSLSVEDRDFALLLKLFLEGMLMGLIQQRAESDDAYALQCAELITDLMAATMKRVPRGKPRPTKSA